jgi:hypothetical protein
MCLITDWTTGRLRFDPRQRRKDLSSSLCVQTGSGAHPAGDKARPGRDADHSPHLVPWSWMSRSYTSSPPSASMACSRKELIFAYIHTYIRAWVYVLLCVSVCACVCMSRRLYCEVIWHTRLRISDRIPIFLTRFSWYFSAPSGKCCIIV